MHFEERVMEADDSLKRSAVCPLGSFLRAHYVWEARTHVVSRLRCACAGVRLSRALALSRAGGGDATRCDLCRRPTTDSSFQHYTPL